jgi:hypothetical protein
MAEMNKSHFATMLDSIKEVHVAALDSHTKDAEEKLEAMRLEHDAMSDRARRDVETARAELEVSLLVDVAYSRLRGPSARH